MVIPDFHHFGARHPETGALKHLLAYRGATAPHTGQPYTEQMLFGLGGGIGFAYFLFERSGTHPIHLETRIHTKETEQPEFYQRIATRIAAPLQVRNSSSPTAADTNLRRHLEEGRPQIVTLDAARLPYLGLAAGINTYYAVVVYGIDENTDRVLLSDRCNQPLTVTREELRRARESSWSPKFRSLLIDKPDSEIDLQGAVRESIRECTRQMNEGLGITNFGVRGIEKWATVLNSSKEKKSWTKIFPPGPTLYGALFSIFAQISMRSATGNAHRAIYADFLEEAADLLSLPPLRESAELYRRCDQQWGEVADAHLPSSVGLFNEAKELALRCRCLFESKGAEAREEIDRSRDRLLEIEKEAGENFPLSFQDSRALLGDLRQRILQLRDAEAEALRSLESAIA